MKGVFLFIAFTFSTVCLSSAAVLTVTSAADAGAGSLRAHLASSMEGDIIEFDPLLNGSTITLTSGSLVIQNIDITINGPGHELLTISGNNASKIFEINHAGELLDTNRVVINGLRLVEGFDPDAAVIDLYDLASNKYVLRFSNLVIENNVTELVGGSLLRIYNASSPDSTIIDSCRFLNNSGTNIVANRASIDRCLFSGNVTGSQLLSIGDGFINNSSFVNNQIGMSLIAINRITQSTYAGEIIYCTFSNNSYTDPTGGSIIDTKVATIYHCTFYDNAPVVNVIYSGEDVYIEANSNIYNCTVPHFVEFHLFGTDYLINFSANDNCVSNDASLGSSNSLVNTDPMLDVLATNGSFLPTHSLLPGSPAINFGLYLNDEDQVGNPIVGNADVGAIESNFSAKIQEINSNIDVSVFPNPTSQTLNIMVPVGVEFNFQLSDANGKIILDKKFSSDLSNIDISQLNNGLYLYKVVSEGKVNDGKLIIRK